MDGWIHEIFDTITVIIIIIEIISNRGYYIDHERQLWFLLEVSLTLSQRTAIDWLEDMDQVVRLELSNAAGIR